MNQPLSSSEALFFFEHAFDLMAVVGTDGYFKRVNPVFERVLGYTPQELTSRPLREFLHPEDVSRTGQGIQILAGGTPRLESKNRYRCKDGSFRWFSWNTSPEGPLLFTVGRDITEQVRAEEEIRKLNTELSRHNEDLEKLVAQRLQELQTSQAQLRQLQKMDAIGRLSGGIAHDFNNMLAAISLHCDLMAEQAGEPQAVLENVEELRAVTERAAALTRQLLILSRKQIIKPQALDVNSLIRPMEKMLTRLLGETISIVLNLSEDLGAIHADPSQIEQVVLNLVVNARDAMPQGGRITLETKNVDLDEAFTSTHLSVRPGPYVLLSVSDQGCGMTPDLVEKIFEPFFTTKPAGQGTGLGLSTTYGIVKQAGGTIWVYSEPGRGSVFKIYLPIVHPQRLGEIPSEPADSAPLLGNATILLVEDDERLRKGFAAVLSQRGFQVLSASSPKQALELCQAHPGTLHLLLTDVVLPEMSGLELAQRALALRPDLRVLFMSGYTSEALSASPGAPHERLEFLQKPFDARSLIAKIQTLLSQTPGSGRSSPGRGTRSC